MPFDRLHRSDGDTASLLLFYSAPMAAQLYSGASSVKRSISSSAGTDMVIFEFSPASSPIPTVTTLTLYFFITLDMSGCSIWKRRYLIDRDSATSELYETASDMEISAVSVERTVKS